MPQNFQPDFPRLVSWTRGEHCSRLAELLATERTDRVHGDLFASCVANRPDLVVMRRRSSFNLVSTATPMDLAPDRTRSVIAAVAGGPHSRLAAAIAARVGTALGVTADAISAYRRDADRDAAAQVLQTLELLNLPLGLRTVNAPNAARLVDDLPPDCLLVLGAPGGSWLHRQFLGPGARLMARAPAGAVVVQAAPVRAFHYMRPGTCLGGHLPARDAVLATAEAVMPVCEEGRLIGVVRREVLLNAPPDTEIGQFVEPAPFASMLEPLEDLHDLASYLDGSPIPLVDPAGVFVGCIDPAVLPEPSPGA